MERNKLPMAAPARRKTAPAVCPCPWLKKLPEFRKRELALCPLPREGAEALKRAWRAAPQFAKLDAEKLIAPAREGLRLILLSDSAYYARQAAMMLSAMSREALPGGKKSPPAEDDDPWSDEELLSLVEEIDGPEDPEEGMAVVSPALLDEKLSGASEGPGVIQGIQEKKLLDLASFRGKSILVAGGSGPALSAGVLEQLEAASERSGEEAVHLFVALHPVQADLEALEKLRFDMGFRVCEIGKPDRSYLRSVLAAAAAECGLKLSPSLDADSVIDGIRAYRGREFEEADLYRLLRAVKRTAPSHPLGAEDLRFRPYRSERNGAEEALERMIGLKGAKEALRGLLAVQLLHSRRGDESAQACRNLAFCGSPGTGKSVTARLFARILREKGCGSGRFVEAGREQLIGAYLGQTSPKVAELFEKARGGVLFIDEAGALLGNDDLYAAEAVNALVRHMELQPETMVIFATYEPELRRLLASNAGLSSRISRIIRFEDYSDGELCEILELMARQNGLALPEDPRGICEGFFAALRKRKGPLFGNGREARRFFEAAQEQLALRCLRDGGGDAVLTAEDLSAAARDLLRGEGSAPDKRRIGF